MSSLRLAVIALVIVPALASAQRRSSRGSSRANWDEVTSTSSRSGIQLSTKDVEKMSPIKLLLDKKKDLKLTDDQQNTVKGLEGKLDEKNKPLLETLDSLRKETKISSSRPSDEDVAKAAIAHSAFVDLLARIRSSYDSSLTEAMPVLDATQQATAKELLAKQRSETAETIREKLSSGNRRRSGS